MAGAIRPRRGPSPTDDGRNPVDQVSAQAHVFRDDAGNESAASDRIVDECPDAGLDLGTTAGFFSAKSRAARVSVLGSHGVRPARATASSKSSPARYNHHIRCECDEGCHARSRQDTEVWVTCLDVPPCRRRPFANVSRTLDLLGCACRRPVHACADAGGQGAMGPTPPTLPAGTHIGVVEGNPSEAD